MLTRCSRGLLAATALALVGCGNPEFTLEDSGSTETFEVGDEFDITLPTNKSAGHSWSVDISNPAVVTLQGTEYDHDSDTDGG
ncbi:MAG: protease inhibitor I42 family protein, partial [Deltaproteobacteria bacterium]|nr:protease inhibitor I42 family protein [Deltaproteobacteria bacterium]